MTDAENDDLKIQIKELQKELTECQNKLRERNEEYEDLDRETDEVFADNEQLQKLCEEYYRELQDLKAERTELLTQINFCKATETIKNLMEEARRNHART